MMECVDHRKISRYRGIRNADSEMGSWELIKLYGDLCVVLLATRFISVRDAKGKIFLDKSERAMKFWAERRIIYPSDCSCILGVLGFSSLYHMIRRLRAPSRPEA